MYLFEEVAQEDNNIFDSWLKHENVNKEIAIDDWHKYFEYANSDPDYFLIKVLFENKIIGVIGLAIEEQTGYIMFIINPDEQNKGHGKKILNLFLQQINHIMKREIKYIYAGIFPNNIASRRCFESCGFEFTENSEDGDMQYIYNYK